MPYPSINKHGMFSACLSRCEKISQADSVGIHEFEYITKVVLLPRFLLSHSKQSSIYYLLINNSFMTYLHLAMVMPPLCTLHFPSIHWVM